MKKKPIAAISVGIWITIFAYCTSGQATEFTYQGSLKDNAALANANYDFEFALFDTPSGGSQIGATIPKNAVLVTNGLFAVKLDFGAVFPGANRYLEIRVRLSGQPNLTPLTPRQLVSSAPYSVKSLNADNATNATNATQLGGTAANQYVLTGDARLSDARQPTAGSANYIQNQNASPQTSSNFNISGNGTANVLNAATQYNLGGQRMLSVSGPFSAGLIATASNTFLGENAGVNTTPAVTINDPTGKFNTFAGALTGVANTTGANNSFFGGAAGNANTVGSQNSFFGVDAGRFNTTGDNNTFSGGFAGFRNTNQHDNTFIGSSAGFTNGMNDSTTLANLNTFVGSRSGYSNTTGGSNSFFGYATGSLNTTGFFNAFVGQEAGTSNTAGFNNSLLGFQAGFANSTGSNNTLIGNLAGSANTTGSNNTIIGSGSNVSSNNLVNATAIGANAVVSQSNSLVLGSINGVNGATASANVGIGTATPNTALHVRSASTTGFAILMENTSTAKRLYMGNYGTTGAGNHWPGLDSANTSFLYAENTLVFTAPNGIHFSGSTTAEHVGILPNGNVGIGTTSPGYKLHVNSATPNAFAAHIQTNGLATGTSYGLVISAGTDVTDSALQIRDQAGNPIMRVRGNGDVGIGTTNPAAKLSVAGTMTVSGNSVFGGQIEVNSLLVDNHAGGGITQTCWNGPTIANCSSSLRYKTNVGKFGRGLELIQALAPITFNWKSNGMRDVGLAAEDVAKVEPLLVTYNEKGQVEGVKYDRIGVVLINAMKEQQQQIERQKTTIDDLEKEVHALKALVCGTKRRTAICRN